MTVEQKVKISGDSSELQDELEKVKESAANLEQDLGKIAAAGGVAFAGFSAAITGAVLQAGKFETIEAQFTTLTGSVNIAKDVIQDLSDFSATTPFDFPGIAAAGKQLISFGIATDQVRPTLQNLGDVAAASGAPLKDLSLIFGQVQAAGKLTGERLLQLQERAIPIGPALAQTLGVAESSVKDLVSQGKVTTEVFNKAFQTLSQEGGFAFGGMAKQSQTLEGLLSTLGDNFGLVAAAVGQEFLPFAKQAVGTMIDFLGKLRENSDALKAIARVFAAGAGVAGFVTALAGAGLAVFKISQGLRVLSNVLRVGRLAAAGFTGALTLGLGTVIAFLPEIIEFTKAAVEAFNSARTEITGSFSRLADNLLNIGSKIGTFLKNLFTFNFSEIKSSADAVKEAVGQAIDETFADVKKVKQKIEIESEIKEGEETKANEAQKAQLAEQEATAKEAAAKRKAIKQKETADALAEEKRLAGLQAEQRQLTREIIDLEKRGESDELIKIKQDEIAAIRALEQAKSDEDRELAQVRLDNLRAESEERRQAAIQAQILERDDELALREEFRALDAEDRALVEQQKLETLNAEQLRRREVLIESAKKRRDDKRREDAQFIKDEQKHGTAIAKIESIQRTEQIRGVKSATGSLVELQQSRNSKLKSIGRQAAIFNTLISGIEASVLVFKGFSTIPIIGPALGTAAAAATLAFTFEKISQIKRAQKGGIVPGTGSGDIVPTLLEPGEIVVPKQIAPTFAQAFGGLTADDESPINRPTQVFQFDNVIGTREFVNDEMIPAIKDAIEFDNADIGV